MARYHTDISRVPVSVAPSPATSGTSLGVTDANAAFLPDTYPWWGVAVPTGAAPTRANSEIIKVTGGSSAAGTTTYTITRAQGIPVTTAQSITTSFDIYDANSAEANIGLNSLIINETPSGTVDGSNAAFDTAQTYVAGSIQVYRDGQLMKGGGADYTETDSNTITFTTAPVTGSVILVTYQSAVSTAGNADTLDGYHANATPTPNSVLVADSNGLLPTPALMNGGWNLTAAQPSYVSTDDPTGVINYPADVTALIGVGMRLRMTNGGNTIYGIVTAIGSYSGGNTPITFLHEVNPSGNTALHLLANSAITNFAFSYQKAPIGFPLSPAKWTVTGGTNGSQSNPTNGTWYNIGGNIILPIGVWNVSYTFDYYINGSATDWQIITTLSTGNNNESDSTLSSGIYGALSTANLNGIVYKTGVITNTSKTTHFQNLKVTRAGGTGLGAGTSYIKITGICAYL